MEKKFLIFVNSPLQLICAIEAVMKHLPSFDNAEFIFGTDIRRLPQEDQIASLYGIKLEKWSTPAKNLFHKATHHFFYILRLRRRYKGIENLVIGDFRNPRSHALYSALKPRNVILVDDGFETYERLCSKESKLIHYGFNFQDLNIRYFPFIGRIKLQELQIFSFLARNFSLSDITLNEFLYTKSMFKNLLSSKKMTSSYAIIVGTRASEGGSIQLNQEIDLIEQTFELLQNKGFKRVIYFANRLNSSTKLQIIEQMMPVVIPNNMLELWLLEQEDLPCIIAAFGSTALITIPMIFPDVKPILFSYPDELIPHEHKASYNKFVKYLKENSVDRIRLN